MAGIYLHIPFCKQACHYCDFHFSTSFKQKLDLINAVCKEIEMRKDEISYADVIETIYLGGGTPSILNDEDLSLIFKTIEKHFNLSSVKEITLEANPDDLDASKLNILRQLPVNRLSIGIQSFCNDDLLYLGRAHNGMQASDSVKRAQDKGFENISIDLIYGIQTLDNDKWKKNIQSAIDIHVPHISAYSLTVEENTALHYFIKKKKYPPIEEERQVLQFEMLTHKLKESGFIHYEISNFGREGNFSLHNSNYWKGQKYIGIGPSAHSFDGKERKWNVSNNSRYIHSLMNGQLEFNIEQLTDNNRFNEYLLVSLRTMWGADLNHILKAFGEENHSRLEKSIIPFISKELILKKENMIYLSDKGKLLADAIVSDLFII